MENSEIEIMSENIDQNVRDNVVISIDKMLEGLPRVNPKCNTIYQVPKELREINDKAYVPQFISIGPFHYRTRKDLIANEHYKLQGFFNFLGRISIINSHIQLLEENQVNISSKVLVEKSHDWVKEAWNCYAEPIKMKDEEFIIMMLVDACFIVEFFLLYYGSFHEDGKLFNAELSLFYYGVFYEILLDLIKLENQVPFFLLQNLFDLMPKDKVDISSIIGGYKDSPISLIDLTYMVLKEFGFVREYKINNLYHKNPKHLLDFLSFYFLPVPPNNWNRKFDHVKISKQWRLSPPTTTELCEAGVTIKVAKRKNNLCFMNISFKNGVLEIPPIVIEGTFEVLIRNVLAFEIFPAGNQKKYAIQYVTFLDDLISTEKDLCLLVKAGVIINDTGGSDKEVSELFNSLTKLVTTPLPSYFDDTSKALRVHCDGSWNKAKASLKHSYFNTPWAIISFFAATFLIILTILQTIFSAISAFPN
ncbi:UPF0481 protein At3g47200 [Cucumis sativus]|uniref:Uncharacterized protein n=1 Tax=Cucumis sativus TaxID=3659 RepID=A0A0A0LQ57_CUCSA|nr:UPF0481 protein At3g47200 [Cucumis sativus]